MKNHISVFNQVSCAVSKGTTLNNYYIGRNINVVPILSSKKYNISNFSIVLEQIRYILGLDVFQKSNLFLRLYLDENPIINRLNDEIYTIYKYNGITGNTNLEYNLINVSDSSNQNFYSNTYNNYLEFNLQNTSKQDYDIIKNKTLTVGEFPLISRSFSKVSSNPPLLTIANSQPKDFFFDSLTYSKLVFTVFSYFFEMPIANNTLNLDLDLNINFDLEEI